MSLWTTVKLAKLIRSCVCVCMRVCVCVCVLLGTGRHQGTDSLIKYVNQLTVRTPPCVSREQSRWRQPLAVSTQRWRYIHKYLLSGRKFNHSADQLLSVLRNGQCNAQLLINLLSQIRPSNANNVWRVPLPLSQFLCSPWFFVYAVLCIPLVYCLNADGIPDPNYVATCLDCTMPRPHNAWCTSHC